MVSRNQKKYNTINDVTEEDTNGGGLGDAVAMSPENRGGSGGCYYILDAGHHEASIAGYTYTYLHLQLHVQVQVAHAPLNLWSILNSFRANASL